MAFPLGDGQIFTQLEQPKQSSGDTAIRNCKPSLLPNAGIASKFAGPLLTSSSVASTGRIVACGHTNAHWLHWIQFSLIQCGTNNAAPRFSYAAVPFGKVPSS